MKNEEKLAFWINVHNAMMMHVKLFSCPEVNIEAEMEFALNISSSSSFFQAHIEYGIPQSNSKRILLTKVERPRRIIYKSQAGLSLLSLTTCFGAAGILHR
jgi:hypothetical protein|uniref:DUF547 domain-containing protein n=1 Tax=Zea mays TaxID=4577 RepID=C0PJQ1_MAIZE|nr:unknown [Zea mays]